MLKKDHAAKNAIRTLYLSKYALDKTYEFKIPRLKVDQEAYLHRLLDMLDEAFETGNVVKYKGHVLKWFSKNDKEEETI